MPELTTWQEIMFSIFAAVALLALICPWLSLLSLNKLDDVARELQLIREEMEKRNK